MKIKSCIVLEGILFIILFSFCATPIMAQGSKHAYVDLGLPSGTLWATCNVGASSPTGYGSYFAWGEVKPKTYYSWHNYRHCDGGTYYIKYNSDSSRGLVDNKDKLDIYDDAAYVNWGKEWRMPTDEQFFELSLNCSQSVIYLNGVRGFLFRSRYNGNSIFLPSAGFRFDGYIKAKAWDGCYWSSTLGKGYFNTKSSVKNCRTYGLSVRPVRRILPTSINLKDTQVTVCKNYNAQLTASVNWPRETPWDFKPIYEWVSSNTSVVTVDQSGTIHGVSEGTATIKCILHYEDITRTAECNVSVIQFEPQYVDLGLPSGTLWATCNVGAYVSEDLGSYFAWGDTCAWADSKYKNDYDHNLPKLDSSHDAAYVKWGLDWQIPSKDQCEELINSSYTKATWITQDGVRGCLITSKSNGNHIFLPSSESGYWTGTAYDKGDANYLYCIWDDWARNLGMHYHSRDHRLLIRPVRRFIPLFMTMTPSEITFHDICKKSLTAEVNWIGEQPRDTPFFLKWSSSDETIAKVDDKGVVTSVSPGTATITCEYEGDLVGEMAAKCNVTIVQDPQYVDLGLPSGTLWATCNIGALSPEKSGYYFAWGETSPKSNYEWNTYKYYKGSSTNFTKYNTNSKYGIVDKKKELELEDDAAYVNWGEDWCMPSYKQFKELCNSSYTTATFKEVNGEQGVLITSKKNGNSIFLPQARCYKNKSISTDYCYGGYWSRTLDSSEPFWSHTLAWSGRWTYSYLDPKACYSRYFGFPVRPVRRQKN